MVHVLKKHLYISWWNKNELQITAFLLQPQCLKINLESGISFIFMFGIDKDFSIANSMIGTYATHTMTPFHIYMKTIMGNMHVTQAWCALLLCGANWFHWLPQYSCITKHNHLNIAKYVYKMYLSCDAVRQSYVFLPKSTYASIQ